jgi:hypothetical protein
MTINRAAGLLLVAAAYVGAGRIMLAPIFNFAKPASASFEGDARAFIWVLAWDNHALLDRVPSLFDANKLYPLPNALAYGEHLYGISLFTLPTYALTRNPVLAYNVVWLLAYVFTAAAFHWLAWRYTHDHLAAIVAGMAGAFCFFRMHHGHGHLNLIWSFWIPLSFIAMERWAARPTWARFALVTAIVVLQSLAAWYEAVMIVVADGVFLLWLLLVERAPLRLPRLALQAAAGTAVAFVCIWPFARHYRILHNDTPAFAAGSAADLAGWLVPPENTFVGQWLVAQKIPGPRWIWGEQTVYLGWIVLILGIAGAIVAWRSHDAAARRARFFIVLGIVAAVLALGPSAREVKSGAYGWSSPFGLLAHIPLLSLFRIPARYSQLMNLALAVLAAIACAAAHRRFRWPARGFTIAATLLLLADFYVVNFPGGAPQPFPIPTVYRHLSTLPPGPVFSVPHYADTPLWFQEANYQYFSTAHWHPTVNGDAREWPREFRALVARLRQFPNAESAAAMRQAGITYVVLHTIRAEERALVEQTRTSPDFRQLARFDYDYLFEVSR